MVTKVSRRSQLPKYTLWEFDFCLVEHPSRIPYHAIGSSASNVVLPPPSHKDTGWHRSMGLGESDTSVHKADGFRYGFVSRSEKDPQPIRWGVSSEISDMHD